MRFKEGLDRPQMSERPVGGRLLRLWCEFLQPQVWGLVLRRAPRPARRSCSQDGEDQAETPPEAMLSRMLHRPRGACPFLYSLSTHLLSTCIICQMPSSLGTQWCVVKCPAFLELCLLPMSGCEFVGGPKAQSQAQGLHE